MPSLSRNLTISRPNFVYRNCSIPNHFHIYLRTRDANLSRFMQSLLTSFCILSNKKRRSSGHVFQGRFKAQLVEDEYYRSHVSRYIHLNPIRTRRFRNATLEERHQYLREYNWSSYRHFLGTKKVPKWLDSDSILADLRIRMHDLRCIVPAIIVGTVIL